MTTYLVRGFSRQDRSKTVHVLIDSSDDEMADSRFARAGKIAGNSICFIASENINPRVSVPDDCKGVLLNSDEELYARVPALAPPPRHRRRARAK